MNNRFAFHVPEPNPELVKAGVHVSPEDWHGDYPKLYADLGQLFDGGKFDQFNSLTREASEHDFFFFSHFVLKLPINHPFLMARCYDIQERDSMVIDLWAREHWKSTLNTFAYTLFEIINNPAITIGIFSHTRDIAKAHLRNIKTTMEQNPMLHILWPDIFWQDPMRANVKWSEDDGLIVKRPKSVPEATVEAHGVIERQPVGKHFGVLHYDDVVTATAVSTPFQREKTAESFALSDNLGKRGGKKRIIGTRYHMGDVYGDFVKRPEWHVRLFPAEVEVDDAGGYVGKRGGIPVYFSEEELDQKFDKQGEYVYSSQNLLNPTAESLQGFQKAWLNYYRGGKRPYLNIYMVVDPATAKGKRSDYTAMIVYGVDSRRNYYILDMVRDRLNLMERWIRIRQMVNDWGVRDVGYERYGMQADIDYFRMQMQEDGFFFNIIELGGQVSKHDRIKSLVPFFQRSRVILPQTCPYTDITGKTHDLTYEFVTEEYETFPFSTHDDLLDCMARMNDAAMPVSYPTRSVGDIDTPAPDPLESALDYDYGTWMTA